MSAARAGSRSSGPSVARTRAGQSRCMSGLAQPRHAVEGGEEAVPAAALAGECFFTLRRETVEAAAALAALLDPAALDQAATLEPVEDRIERGDVELQRAAGSPIDQLGELVAVAVVLLEERHDQHFGAALAQLAVGRHRWSAYRSE